MARLSLLLLALLLAVHSCRAEDYCFPSDYDRQSAPCDTFSNTRVVTYIKRRNCSDPFPVQPQHAEPCDCTPEDYMATYSMIDNKCSVLYVPTQSQGGADSCKGVPVSPNMQVDDIYCDLEKQGPCTQDHMRVTYSQCFEDETHSGLQEPAVEVIYYFNSSCNPAAKGSIHLPPNTFLPCATKCGAGSVLVRDACQSCKPGTYSMGGGMRFKYFDFLDKKLFKTACKFRNATGEHDCDQGWHVYAGSIVAGPFDEPNEWFQDECASDPAYNCHNNVRASLDMTVRLVRDGYVKFKYTVGAEKKYDGLLFFLDAEDEPVLPIKSNQMEPREVMFNLTEGFHTLTWIYLKDEKWTSGHDSASITYLEVDGTDFNDVACTPCEPGYFSGPGASECTRCPVSSFSAEGAPECSLCPSGTYTLHDPKATCLPKPPCNLSLDATFSYSFCDAASKTRKKTWHWLEPQICDPATGQDLPPETTEPCPDCAPGTISVVQGGERICKFCPPGEARDGMTVEGTEGSNVCVKCDDGNVAIKEFSLKHFNLLAGNLPAPFTTGCCCQDCASSGWRVANGAMDSGTHHGASVSVWLKLQVDLEMMGEVTFNFSVDIPSGDSSRGFFFIIDDLPTDEMSDGGTGAIPITRDPLLSGPWQLGKGNHTLMWLWKKTGSVVQASRDSAIIYDIKVRGVANGGASMCEPVPEGAMLVAGGSSWIGCPPGTFSEGKTSACKPCPANTYNLYEFGGSWACLPCGEGTSSLPGSTSCQIGDAAVPETFCTYTPPSPGYNASQLTVYDLAPLSSQHPGRMFGPIFDNPAAPKKQDGAMYFVSVCDTDYSNTTCVDYAGLPLNTSACRVNPKTALDGKHRPAHSLGTKVSLVPLSSDPGLARRGFVMSLTGDRCIATEMESFTNITFICDPDAGFGEPRAWTDKGKQAAFDPRKQIGNWVVRSGKYLPISQYENCTYEMVWYTVYACPLCSYEDYEQVQVQGCLGNKYITYKYKQPKTCQANAEQPLPPDIPCKPCTMADYTETKDSCADEHGTHNTTYQWNNPKICNDELEGSAQLPDNVAAGPCVHTVFLVSENVLGPKYLAILILGSLAILVLAIVSVVTYVRSRKIYSMYSKLVETEGGEGEDDGEDFGDHEEEMEEVEAQGNSASESSLLRPRDEEDSSAVVADPTDNRV